MALHSVTPAIAVFEIYRAKDDDGLDSKSYFIQMHRANVPVTYITTDLLQTQKAAPEIYKIDSTPQYVLTPVKDVSLTQTLLTNTRVYTLQISRSTHKCIPKMLCKKCGCLLACPGLEERRPDFNEIW